MKKQYTLRRITALCLAACLLLPGTAIAASAQENTEIAYEDLSQRKENSRIYQKTDNSFVSVSTAAPMHFWKNGQWTSIDNTLQKSKGQDGSTIYVNNSNPYRVELPERLSPEQGVTMSMDGHSLTFTLKNAQKRSTRADIEKQTAAPGATEAEKLAGLEKLSTKITYDSVLTHTNVQYIVSKTQLKENIILEKAPAQPASYTYHIAAGGLNAVLQKDFSILFETAQGQCVFEIPAPVMLDNQKSRSMDIGVSLKKAEHNSYLLTYTPSMDWLTAPERSYPVLVDPVVLVRELTHDQQGSDDTYVDSKTPDMNYNDSDLLTLSRDASSNTILYIKPQPIFTTLKKVIKKALVRYHKAGEFRLDENAMAGLFAVTESWYKGITYQNRPAYNDGLPIDIAPMSGKYLEFDITQYVRELAYGELTNEGFAVQMVEGSGTAWYDSVESPDASWLPVYIFDYTNPNGANTSYMNQEWDMGRAGIVRFQEFSQQMSIERMEIGYPHGRMPVEIKRVFNSGNSSFSLDPISNFNSSYGGYWQTNYDQSVTPQSTPDGTSLYLYISEDATPMYFRGTGQIVNHYEKCVLEEPQKHPGKDLELYYPVDPPKEWENVIFMLADQQTIYAFDKTDSGRLGIIVGLEDLPALMDNESQDAQDVPHITINRHIDEYKGRGKGRIHSILDGDGREYVFQYNGKFYLTSITLYDYKDPSFPIQRVAYTYAPDNSGSIIELDMGKFLTATTFPDGEVVTYDFGDNIVWLPNRITNTQNQTVLEFYFSNSDLNFPVKKVVYSQYHDDLDNKTIIKSCDYQQLDTGLVSITDESGNTQIKKFDLDGNLERITTPAGKLLYQRSDHGSDYDVNQGFSENLIANAGFEDGLSSWNTAGIVLGTGDAVHSGSKAAMMINASELAAQQPAVYQRYTANAFVMTPQGVTDMGAKLLLEALDAQGTVLGAAESAVIGSTQGQWQALSVDYTVPMGVESVRAKIIGTGTGVLYADDIALRKNGMALGESLLQNHDFTQDPALSDSAWSILSGTSCEWLDFEDSQLEGRMAPELDSHVFALYGNLKEKAQISQTVSINAKAGDQFCISAWAKGVNVFSLKDGRTFGIRVEAPTADGSSTEVLCEYSFDPYTNRWQYGAKLFTLDREIRDVTVRILYDYQCNGAAFDGVQLSHVLL